MYASRVSASIEEMTNPICEYMKRSKWDAPACSCRQKAPSCILMVLDEARTLLSEGEQVQSQKRIFNFRTALMYVGRSKMKWMLIDTLKVPNFMPSIIEDPEARGFLQKATLFSPHSLSSLLLG